MSWAGPAGVAVLPGRGEVFFRDTGPVGDALPVLLLHGGRDRMVPAAHSRWLAARCPAATLRIAPDDGHLTVLDHAESALSWLAGHRRPATG